VKVRLVVIGGKKDGLEIPITRTRFLIGRGEQCHVRLQNKLIGDPHCVIAVAGGSLVLEDCGASSGTFLNGERVQCPRKLRNNDRIKLPALELAVKFVAEKPKPPVQSAPPADDFDILQFIKDDAEGKPSSPRGIGVQPANPKDAVVKEPAVSKPSAPKISKPEPTKPEAAQPKRPTVAKATTVMPQPVKPKEAVQKTPIKTPAPTVAKPQPAKAETAVPKRPVAATPKVVASPPAIANAPEQKETGKEQAELPQDPSAAAKASLAANTALATRRFHAAPKAPEWELADVWLILTIIPLVGVLLSYLPTFWIWQSLAGMVLTALAVGVWLHVKRTGGVKLNELNITTGILAVLVLCLMVPIYWICVAGSVILILACGSTVVFRLKGGKRFDDTNVVWLTVTTILVYALVNMIPSSVHWGLLAGVFAFFGFIFWIEYRMRGGDGTRIDDASAALLAAASLLMYVFVRSFFATRGMLIIGVVVPLIVMIALLGIRAKSKRLDGLNLLLLLQTGILGVQALLWLGHFWNIWSIGSILLLVVFVPLFIIWIRKKEKSCWAECGLASVFQIGALAVFVLNLWLPSQLQPSKLWSSLWKSPETQIANSESPKPPTAKQPVLLVAAKGPPAGPQPGKQPIANVADAKKPDGKVPPGQAPVAKAPIAKAVAAKAPDAAKPAAKQENKAPKPPAPKPEAKAPVEQKAVAKVPDGQKPVGKPEDKAPKPPAPKPAANAAVQKVVVKAPDAPKPGGKKPLTQSTLLARAKFGKTESFMNSFLSSLVSRTLFWTIVPVFALACLFVAVVKVKTSSAA
jgi:hypothetical protein